MGTATTLTAQTRLSMLLAGGVGSGVLGAGSTTGLMTGLPGTA